MDVQQLSPSFGGERNLLATMRRSLDDADEALLCVAFASMGGVHLLRDELQALGKRNGVLLLVTTVFGSTAPAALQFAKDLGVSVRVMNHSRGTYHPKVYVTRRGDQVSVITGSANLTNGIVANVEMATKLVGDMREPELARTLAWARDLWDAPSVVPWEPRGAIENEVLDPILATAIEALARASPVIETLGTKRARNRIVQVVPQGVYVETERSEAHQRGAQLVPSWMIQLAWDFVRTHGALTNKFLLANDGLNVKRSSFVCALLSRVPGLQPMKNEVGVQVVVG